MNTAGSTETCASTQHVSVSFRAVIAGRSLDYLELTKPRIAALVLFTVTVGYMLGHVGDWRSLELLHTLFGIGLVAAAANALNQYAERETDAQMSRTANRPLPAGRIEPAEAIAFGFVTGVGGIAYLAWSSNGLTAMLAALTLGVYVGVYTPLKRVTSLCTTVGAIAGALPPLLGWTAASGSLDHGALALFTILYLWQFPHFLAIAWLCRDDYAKARLWMLPTGNAAETTRARQHANVVGLLMVAYALALIPISLLPHKLALAGNGYVLAALVLGAAYLTCTFRFLTKKTVRAAREVIWASLIYLPLLLSTLTWDHFHWLG